MSNFYINLDNSIKFREHIEDVTEKVIKFCAYYTAFVITTHESAYLIFVTLSLNQIVFSAHINGGGK